MQNRNKHFKAHFTIVRSYSLVLAILFCVVTFKSTAQVLDDVLTHSVYNIEDGLPTNEIYFCHQDSRGYLWLSTDLGVVRYDGSNFKTYGKAEGLPGVTVFKTYEDANGRLWILTYREGVCYLERDSIIVPPFNETLKTVLGRKNYVHNINVVDDTVYMTTRYSQDSLYIAHRTGEVQKVEIPYLSRYYNTQQKFLWQWKLKNGEYISGLTGRRGPYVTTEEIQYSFDSPAPEVAYHYLGSREYSRYDHENDGDSIFVVSQRERVAMRCRNGSTSVLELSSPVLDIEIYNGNVLLATLGDGVYHYRGSLDVEHLVGHYFSNEAITSIDIDNQGKIWLTSLYSGLINVPSFFSKSFNLPHVSNAQRATELSVRNDTVAYAVDDSLHFLRLTNNRLDEIQSFKLAAEAYRHILYPSNLAWLDDWALYYHHKVFTPHFGSKAVLQGASVTPVIRPYVHTVYPYNGVFYLGTRHGIQYPIEDTLIFDSNYDLDFDNEVYSIIAVEDGLLLLGTQSGLYIHDVEAKTIERVENSNIEFSVIDIQRDRFGRIWIATKEDGLYTLENGVLSEVEISNFNSQLVCYVIEFKGDNAWLGSNKGVLKFSFDEKSVQFIGAFSKLDGLAFDFVKEIHLDGENVILRSSDRISTMPIELLLTEESNPKLYLEALRIGNAEYRGHQLDDITFPKGANNLEFTVRPDILDQRGLEMQYRLLGIDNAWRKLSNNSVSLVKVPPGHYQFEVKLRNGSSEWQQGALLYDFTISKRLVDKLWFRWSVIVFVLSIVAVYLYVRRLRIQRRAMLENQMMRSGLRSLRTQMNPHFMFNALNSIRHFMLDNDLTKADGYLVKFSGLLRGVLENMEEYKVPIKEEIELLNAYMTLEDSRLRHGLDWDISVDEAIDVDRVLIPTMLFQPLLENSIWHGVEPLKSKGKVSLTFELADSMLICRLVDNGVGFEFEEASFEGGIGLRNVQERLKLYEQLDERPYSISFDSRTDEMNHGTEITINIPL